MTLIAVNEAYLSFRGSFDKKRARDVSEVFKGLSNLPNAPFIAGDVHVDLWRYRTYGERTLVRNLYAVQTGRVKAWRGRYLIHTDAICWQRAIVVSQFRYEDRYS